MMTSDGNKLRYRSAELTDPGKVAALNEDAVLSLPDRGVFCVADGMGSIPEEETASRTAVRLLSGKIGFAEPDSAIEEVERLVRRALDEAAYWIRQRSEEHGGETMATTAALLVLNRETPDKSFILHAGDSRCYRHRDGKLALMTTDHSIAAMAGISDEADLPPMLRGVVTNAIGTSEEVELDKAAADVREGDTFLLCSDGLTSMLSDDRIETMIQQNDTADLPALVNLLVTEANEAGGKDNISVILVHIDACSASGATQAQ